MYPVILRNLITNCPDDVLFEVFDTLMNVECYELPKTSDACMDVGVAYISHFNDDVQELIESFEDNLEKRENMISPIVFLAGSSKYVNPSDNKDKFRALSDKILVLAN